MSDDGSQALTIIGFIGSVFSPYYRLSRSRGDGDPLEHCALNVALYEGTGRKRWALTERSRGWVVRDRASLVLGPSRMRWEGGELLIDIDELTVPLPSRIRGRVRVIPAALGAASYALDGRGLHRWRPIAPCARAEVDLLQPSMRWSGNAYVDTNAGDEPLENRFAAWSWSRAALGSSTRGPAATAVMYEALQRDGGRFSTALYFSADGSIDPFVPPPAAALPPTLWRMPRTARSEEPQAARVLRTLEDAPFYARSLVSCRLRGQPSTAVHESLSLTRWRSPWVQLMLPFRMPRRTSRRTT